MADSNSSPEHVIGIDVAKEVHVACGIARDGALLFRARRIRSSRPDLNAFDAFLRTHCQPDRTRIGMEATGHYWILLHAFLVGRGWSVVVFNPVLSSQAARANTRGRVTDADDALTIAKVVRDGVKPSQVCDSAHAHLRELTRRRNELMERRVSDLLRLQAQVEVVFPEFLAVMGRVEKTSSLTVLHAAPGADLIAASTMASLAEMIDQASRGQLDGSDLAQRLKTAASDSLAAGRRDPGRETIIRQLADSIRHLDRQIADLDRTIVASAANHVLPAIALLDKLPGFGPVTTPATAAEFGDLQRFVSTTQDGIRHVAASAMLAHAGLDPRVRSSGKWVGQAKMSKRGSPHLRRSLLIAASIAVQRDDWCAGLYRRYRRKVSSRGYWFALSHVARHLVQALAAAVKYGEAFTWKLFVASRKAQIVQTS